MNPLANASSVCITTTAGRVLATISAHRVGLLSVVDRGCAIGLSPDGFWDNTGGTISTAEIMAKKAIASKRTIPSLKLIGLQGRGYRRIIQIGLASTAFGCLAGKCASYCAQASQPLQTVLWQVRSGGPTSRIARRARGGGVVWLKASRRPNGRQFSRFGCAFPAAFGRAERSLGAARRRWGTRTRLRTSHGAGTSALPPVPTSSAMATGFGLGRSCSACAQDAMTDHALAWGQSLTSGSPEGHALAWGHNVTQAHGRLTSGS